MKFYSYWVALFIAFSAGSWCRTEETSDTFLQEIKTDEAAKIAYRETRTLSLFEHPWHGRGYLYAMPPDSMIKEQIEPARLVMGIKGEQMFYFDPGNGLRHRSELADDDPVSLNIAVFRALSNADEALLHRLYRSDIVGTADGWTMTLTPKQDDAAGLRITIKGKSGRRADYIELRQADGDTDEYWLHPEASGVEVEAAIQRLYRELLGD
ncbi:MAG: LolA family protein [Gammaproteobacteria bacterium]